MKEIENGVEKNPDKVRLYREKTYASKAYREKWNSSKYWRNLIFEILNPICNNPNCEVSGRCKNKLCLQIDHINGGGREEREHFKNGTTMYRFYAKRPDLCKERLQILCANCNQIKRFINNEDDRKIDAQTNSYL